MIEYDLGYALINRVSQLGDAFVELFIEQTISAVCSVTNGELQSGYQREIQGAGLRRLHGNHTFYVHTTDLTEAGLRRLGEGLSSGRQSPTGPAIPFSSPPNWFPLDDLTWVAKQSWHEANNTSDTGIQIHADIRMRAVRQDVLIFGGSDCPCKETRQSNDLRVDIVARKGRRVRTATRAIGASDVARLVYNDAHLCVAREAVHAAVTRLEACEAPSGDITVILAAGKPAALLHEVCGHALEADLAGHPRSALHNLVDKEIATPIISVIDDPSMPEYAPLYHWDDEGEAARPTVLIDHGVLRTYLYDRRTALSAGRPSNGHGRRQSYAHPPLPRMSATYIAPGESSPEEIIAETEDGILVLSVESGEAEASGRFKLAVNEGFRVERGRITTPIRRAILSGYGPTVLRSIDRVGNDLKFFVRNGFCNKQSQQLPVSMGQPTLRVSKLSVLGG